MTLEDLGNIGEIVGAIGVVVSLIYVAIQVRDNSRFVRENTESVKAANEITSNEFTGASYMIMLENPELLDIHVRGDRGDPLEGSEKSRYNLLLRLAFEGHQTYFVQQQRGLVGSEIWEYWSGSMDTFCQNPGVANWWRKNQNRFVPSYQEYINQKIPPTKSEND